MIIYIHTYIYISNKLFVCDHPRPPRPAGGEGRQLAETHKSARARNMRDKNCARARDCPVNTSTPAHTGVAHLKEHAARRVEANPPTSHTTPQQHSRAYLNEHAARRVEATPPPHSHTRAKNTTTTTNTHTLLAASDSLSPCPVSLRRASEFAPSCLEVRISNRSARCSSPGRRRPTSTMQHQLLLI